MDDEVFMVGNTKENLLVAFSGESMARNKYDFFAKVARDEGLIFVAKIFEEASRNELQHAKEEYKLLAGIKDTKANLKSAIEGEDHETRSMYPSFEEAALKEGNKVAAKLFHELALVEAEHRYRFKEALGMLEKGTLLKRDSEIRWKCSKCGHIHIGSEPPESCPLCHHARNYFLPE